MYQYGETVIASDERGWLLDPLTVSPDSLKSRSPSGPWKLRLDRPPQLQHGSLFFSHLFPVRNPG